MLTPHDIDELRSLCRDDAAVDAVQELVARAVARATDEARTAADAHAAPELAWLVEESGDLVSLQDADGRFIWVSGTVRSMLGYGPADLLGADPMAWVHPDERAMLDDGDRSFFRHGSAGERLLFRMRSKAGPYVWLEATGRCVPDEGGRRPATGVQVEIHARDVTERVEALHVSEERLEMALRGASLGLWDWDLRTDRITFNECGALLLGYKTDEQTIGFADWRRLVHPQDRLLLAAAVEQHRDGQTSMIDLDIRVRTSGGQWRWLRHRGRIVEHDAMGQPTRMAGTHQDVTDYKKAGQALRASEERFRLAFDHAAIGMALVGIDGQWLKVNPALCVLLGYAEAELLATDFQTLTHPDDIEADLAYVEQMLRGERQKYQMEKRYLRKDGEVVWALLGVSMVSDEHGRPLHFISQIQDITERRRAHERLLERQAQLHALIENTREPLWLVDTEFRLRVANSPALALLTRTCGQPVSTGDVLPEPAAPEVALDAVLPDVIDAATTQTIAWRDFCTRAFRGREVRTEVDIPRRGGTRTYQFVCCPIVQKSGQVVGATIFGHDVTKHRRLMQMKDEFVSTVSHELRTPITSIRGALSMLAAGSHGLDSEKGRTLLTIAHSNSERLVVLIGDILDLDRIESGRLQLSVQLHPMADVVEEAIQSNQPYAAQHQVALRVEGAIDADSYVRIDRDRMMQVMNNLISNALKFSPAGGEVVVRVETTEFGRVRVAVRDRGPGIPEAFRPYLFDKFTQADASDRRARGGSGLGLSICKALVEQMDGTITYTTAEGEGTTFFVDFPSWDAEGNPRPHQVEPVRPAGLVCEDDPRTAELLADVLADQGYAVDVATDAVQARRRLRERDYTIMALDLVLPGEDGLSLLQSIRTDTRLQALPIVVVSAQGQERSAHELPASLRSGTQWINKPINVKHLQTVVASLTPTRTRPERPQVLHIEDDPSVRHIVRILLGETADVTGVGSLAEARELIRESDMDLVLLDLDLPDGKGTQLLPLLRSRPGGPVPVVVFSGQAPPRKPVLNVNEYLEKTVVTNEKLLSSIRHHLGLTSIEAAERGEPVPVPAD